MTTLNRRAFLSWVLAAVFVPGLATAGEKKLEAGDLIAIQEGGLPVILSAPHGGQGEIPGVVARKGEGLQKGASGFRTERDVNTDLLAFELASELERKLGKKPYFVVAKFHRRYIDANRPADIAVEDPKARQVYDVYHQTLKQFCGEVQKVFGHGLVLDIHGQSSARDTVFRGTQNGKTDRALVQRVGDKAHAGPESFCGLLASHGMTVKPTDTSRETAGFTGGYIVQTCGSHEGIGAIQLEFGSDLRTKAILKTTAAKAADAITTFVKLYFSESRRRNAERIQSFSRTTASIRLA
jgi:N-formylglutamate amidohydrolase